MRDLCSSTVTSSPVPEASASGNAGMAAAGNLFCIPISLSGSLLRASVQTLRALESFLSRMEGAKTLRHLACSPTIS